MTHATNGNARPRKRGLKADYRGASPEQVARAFYWHRRKKTRRAANLNEPVEHRKSA